ncbi:hypothetical protein TSUD_214690 [Trifolium subterraneum]|uniref:CCHC-type domain-containing protein n=1 Tax=Trifolium subterraneum TaxID=3900 RepID=A0A2Z6MMY2_TRISU|nr:hypothetical protein TSUD_214690 [Trifolium subterraneum]
MFGAIDEVLEKTSVKAKDIGILVVNCSLFNPIPSLSAMIVNHYNLRENLLSYNLDGMGCSAGVISIDHVKDLLQLYITGLSLANLCSYYRINACYAFPLPYCVSWHQSREGGQILGFRDRNNNNPTTDDSSSEDEEVVTEDEEEFMDWQIDVDRFFDVMDIPENKQVKMVAIRLKSTAAVWWDRLVLQRHRQKKHPIRTWRKMKRLMLERFLPKDYEQILYKMYIECVQGKRSVTEYTAEFLRFSERNDGRTVWTVAEASNLALKAELLEKSPRSFSNFRRYSPQNNIDDKEKSATTKDSNPVSKADSSGSAPQGKNPTQKQNNPYAKPTGDTCFRCGGKGHMSNVCPSRRVAAVLEERVDDDEREQPDEDEYAEVEFAEEESDEKVNIVLQRMLLATKEERQRKNLFKIL